MPATESTPVTEPAASPADQPAAGDQPAVAPAPPSRLGNVRRGRPAAFYVQFIAGVGFTTAQVALVRLILDHGPRRTAMAEVT